MNTAVAGTGEPQPGKQVALFFGSFNPLHNAHVAVARHLAGMQHRYFNFDKVWLVVSPQNPFKKREELMEEKLRLRLLEETFAGDPKIKVSDIEFNMPKPSYTFDTLNAIQELMPEHEPVLVTGSDILFKFWGWKKHEDILRNYKVLVFLRPGYIEGIEEVHKALLEGVPGSKGIYVIKGPLIELSSTKVRNHLSTGDEIDDLVPEAVKRYFDNNSQMDLE